MIAFCLASLCDLVGLTDAAEWLTTFGLWRNMLFM